MNCSNFQDVLTDYLDGALDARARAECAGHRLICRECRELYNEVRETVRELNGFSSFYETPEGLETRILAATTAGEMLSCHEFDRLIERYFDGVMLAPDHQAFQAHFAHCHQCRRLMAGIEEAIELCHEVKELEVEMPSSLPERIMSATSGSRQTGTRLFIEAVGLGFALPLLQRLFVPQWAAASLIFAASFFFVSLHFGSLGGFVSQANGRAEKLLAELNQTSVQARSELDRVSFEFGNVWALPSKATRPTAPQPVATTATPRPATSPTPVLQQAVRVAHP